MPQYTYLVAERTTGRLLMELPLGGVTYDLQVNNAATFHATLGVDSAPGLMELTRAVKTSVFVNRGDVLMFGGAIWGRRYQASQRMLQIDCGDTLSYLDAHVHVTSDLVYKQVDQLAIARSLIQYANSKQGANIAPTYIGDVTSGVLRDRTYLGADKAPVGQRLRELSAVEGGFDFRMESYWDGGLVGGRARRAVRFGYPSLGRTYPASQLVFEIDADTVDYTYTEDGSSMASTVYAVGALPAGAATGAVPPEFVAEDLTAQALNYPRMEATLSYTDITGRAALAAHARGQLALSKRPPETYELTVQGEAAGAPPLGSYLPGDKCLIRIPRKDPLWMNGAEIQGTITGVSVALDDEQNESVTVTVQPYQTVEGQVRA
jgi:hypothetical protein